MKQQLPQSRHNPGCAMLSVDDILNLALFEVVGKLNIDDIANNHLRAIALISDRQIEAFAKQKAELIAYEPPYRQREIQTHFQRLPERLRAWRDRAKLAVN